jgi:hypothetical protein
VVVLRACSSDPNQPTYRPAGVRSFSTTNVLAKNGTERMKMEGMHHPIKAIISLIDHDDEP